MAAKSFRQLIKVCFLRGRGQCGMYNIKERRREGHLKKMDFFSNVAGHLVTLK